MSTIAWPPGGGQFVASDIPAGIQVMNLFSNYSWTRENLTVEQQSVVSHWTTNWGNVYVNLMSYFFFQVRLNFTLTNKNNRKIGDFFSGHPIEKLKKKRFYDLQKYTDYRI